MPVSVARSPFPRSRQTLDDRGLHPFPTEHMKIEHFALNVEDPLAMGRWYVSHLGFTVKRRLVEPPYTHFLADDSGTVMIEIYGQDAPVPNYPNLNVMSLHVALVSEDLDADVRRLVAAGATTEGDIQTFPTGDRYAMLRDPWGLTLQLVHRADPMV